MSAPWGREGVSNNADKNGQWDGGGLAAIGHPFSVWSLNAKRGNLKVISSSSCTKDGKIKRQTRNKYSMRVFFRESLSLHSICSSLIVFQLSVRTGRGRGLLSKKQTGVDRER